MDKYGPLLPLALDKQTVLKSFDNRRDAIKQEFKNMILTSPGERPLRPGFGVGLKNFLFEKMSPNLEGKIYGVIVSQTNRWMSFISVDDMKFFTPTDNSIKIVVYYSIKSLGVGDSLTVEVGK